MAVGRCYWGFALWFWISIRFERRAFIHFSLHRSMVHNHDTFQLSKYLSRKQDTFCLVMGAFLVCFRTILFTEILSESGTHATSKQNKIICWKLDVFNKFCLIFYISVLSFIFPYKVFPMFSMQKFEARAHSKRSRPMAPKCFRHFVSC